MTTLIIEARRTAYSPKDIRRTMTVGELIRYLEDYNEDTPIILSHDNGYTYGEINQYDIREDEYDDDEEDEDNE